MRQQFVCRSAARNLPAVRIETNGRINLNHAASQVFAGAKWGKVGYWESTRAIRIEPAAESTESSVAIHWRPYSASLSIGRILYALEREQNLRWNYRERYTILPATIRDGGIEFVLPLGSAAREPGQRRLRGGGTALDRRMIPPEVLIARRQAEIAKLQAETDRIRAEHARDADPEGTFARLVNEW